MNTEINGSNRHDPSGHSALKRAGAMIVLLFFAAALIGLLVTAFTGGEPRTILVFILLLGLVPSVIYIILYFIRVTRDRFAETNDRV